MPVFKNLPSAPQAEGTWKLTPWQRSALPDKASQQVTTGSMCLLPLHCLLFDLNGYLSTKAKQRWQLLGSAQALYPVALKAGHFQKLRRLMGTSKMFELKYQQPSCSTPPFTPSRSFPSKMWDLAPQRTSSPLLSLAHALPQPYSSPWESLPVMCLVQLVQKPGPGRDHRKMLKGRMRGIIVRLNVLHID